MKKLKQQEEIKVGTDCSGMGAPEQALLELGVKHRNVFACERDQFARLTYWANHHCETMYEDITTRPMEGLEQLDLYIGGFPCQPFSISGLRNGFEDIRGTIFFHCAEFIRINQPRAFILENVKGLLSHDKAKGSKEKHGRTFQTILNLLGKTINGQAHIPFYTDNLGYHLFYKVLDTKKYGIPQNRDRVYIVGLRDESDSFNFPSPVKLNKRLRDILELDVHEKYYLSDNALDRIARRMKDFIPQVNPEITGTINTRNNSGSVSFDRGTTLIDTQTLFSETTPRLDMQSLIEETEKSIQEGDAEDDKRIVVNNEGRWEERENFNAITASYHKCNGTVNRQHSFIIGHTRSKTGEVTKYNEKDTANTLHTSSGTGNNTDQFVVEAEEPVIMTRERGKNEGGMYELAPTITGSNWQNNNHVIQLNKVASLFDNDAEAGRVYDVDGVSSTVKSGRGGLGGKNGLYMVNDKGSQLRIRRLTPRECFRLQGFPDSFKIVVSDTQAYRQAGNSMTVSVIKGVIHNVLLGRK